MALKDYQTALSLATLYEVAYSGHGTEEVQPNLEVVGGTVNIYGSNAADKPPTPPTGMSLTNPVGFVGIDVFASVPRWLYITQASGTTTSIIASGLLVKVA